MMKDVSLNEIRVSRAFETQIPPLLPDEFRQLEENILEEGCVINPLVTWNGVIVDGHNRYRILMNHPEIPFHVFERDFFDENEAVAWICRNQLGRRNLSSGQRKYLIGKQYAAEKLTLGGARNVKTEKPAAGEPDEEISNTQNGYLKNNERTCDRIARENHVGHNYVQRAEKYAQGVDSAEEVSPGIRQKILSGELKPTAREIVEVARAADIPERKKRVRELTSPEPKAPKKPKNSISRIKDISNHMESRADSSAAGNVVDEQAAIDELTDAWLTFHTRWEACFELNGMSGKKLRKSICSLAEKGIRYLKEKEEEANEDN